MRFSSLIMAIVMTVIVLTVCPRVEAKHRYFANVHPLTNYVHRRLGIGWSDGYHAKNGWAVARKTNHHRWHPPATYPQQMQYHSTLWPSGTSEPTPARD